MRDHTFSEGDERGYPREVSGCGIGDPDGSGPMVYVDVGREYSVWLSSNEATELADTLLRLAGRL